MYCMFSRTHPVFFCTKGKEKKRWTGQCENVSTRSRTSLTPFSAAVIISVAELWAGASKESVRTWLKNSQSSFFSPPPCLSIFSASLAFYISFAPSSFPPFFHFFLPLNRLPSYHRSPSTTLRLYFLWPVSQGSGLPKVVNEMNVSFWSGKERLVVDEVSCFRKLL